MARVDGARYKNRRYNRMPLAPRWSAGGHLEIKRNKKYVLTMRGLGRSHFGNNKYGTDKVDDKVIAQRSRPCAGFSGVA